MIVVKKRFEKANNYKKGYDLFLSDIYPYLPSNLRNILGQVETDIYEFIEEIRLRINRPLMIYGNNTDFFVQDCGKITHISEQGYIVTKDDIQKTLHLLSESSIYALEEELKNGFITIKGGHRVGLAGKIIMENGVIKTIKDISSLNIRISKEVIGAADKIIKYIIDPLSNRVFNTLIISPPKCGKTTILRDIVRQLSNGIPNKGFKGINVGVVDERSEIASFYDGVYKKDLGVRTDVLDSCPKAQGIIMLIRSMSPQVIATDEIGKKQDAAAIEEAVNAGVSIITTVHGANIDDIRNRPTMRKILNERFFDVLIFLSNRLGVGTIEKVLDGKTFKPIH